MIITLQQTPKRFFSEDLSEAVVKLLMTRMLHIVEVEHTDPVVNGVLCNVTVSKLLTTIL